MVRKDDLYKLMKTGYKRKKVRKSYLEKSDQYYVDSDLSNENTTVVYDKVNKKPIIIHRGTKTFRDVVTDIAILAGRGRDTNRVKKAKEITKRVEEKYKTGADAIGHSLGGYLAENSGAKGEIREHQSPP